MLIAAQILYTSQSGGNWDTAKTILNVGVMLGQRHRRCANIKPTLGQGKLCLLGSIHIKCRNVMLCKAKRQ